MPKERIRCAWAAGQPEFYVRYHDEEWGEPVVNRWRTMKDVPPKTTLSDTVSKDLKQRGFRFVGSTVIYAHLQATGLVNDQTMDGFRYKELAAR